LTVLIGENDTGKTVFLRAIERFAQSPEQITANDHWATNAGNPVAFVAKVAGPNNQKIKYTELADPSHQKQHHTAAAAVQALLQPVWFHHLRVGELPVECEGHADHAASVPDIGPQGDNVPAVLDYFLRRDRGRFDRLLNDLRSNVPGVADVRIATPAPNKRRLMFVTSEGVEIDGAQMSSGVRLLLFFLTLAHHPRRPKVVLIEEPENGVHPRRLQSIVDILKSVSEGRVGGEPTQVIITTHSPYLLDWIDVDTQQVLVFRRESDGARTASPIDAEGLKLFLDEFRLGEVWYNREEEGLVATASAG
jgi:predicted ATPase